jgi:hypothetical protein
MGRVLLSALCTAVVGIAASHAGAVVIFNDNFTTADPGGSFDINADLSLRQSGTYVDNNGLVSYSESPGHDDNLTQVNNAGQPGTLLIAPQGGGSPDNPTQFIRVTPNADFNSVPNGATSLTVSTTLYPSPTTNFVEFAAGGTYAGLPLIGTFADTQNGVLVFLNASGGYQTFDGPGPNDGAGNVDPASSYQVSWVFNNPVFDGVTPVDTSLFINGVQVDANGAAPGLDFSRPYTNNQVLLAAFGGSDPLNVSYFGPLSVTATTPIPEPAALSALLAPALVALRRRR